MKEILVIDDAATVRLYYRKLLEEAGYAVSEAVNGLEALEKAVQTAFDLHIVDVNMPKLDGYSFLRELRSLDLPQPPVIMVSIEASPKDRKLAYAAGANLYLVKPPRPEQLLAPINLLLRGTSP
jgi:two-component system chemotaxis response regulator CheY